MAELTHAQMHAVLEGGAAVLWRGRIISRSADLPSDEELAAPATSAEGASTEREQERAAAVLVGHGAPAEDLGRPGDRYIDALSGDLYVCS